MTTLLSVCNYCGETFDNAFQLGGHKRQCGRRTFATCAESSFSDSDSTFESNSDSNCTLESNYNGESPLATTNPGEFDEEGSGVDANCASVSRVNPLQSALW